MSHEPRTDVVQEGLVVCPHCNKPFSADLLGGDTERHRGFKCPHCRLFVPAERVVEP